MSRKFQSKLHTALNRASQLPFDITPYLDEAKDAVNGTTKQRKEALHKLNILIQDLNLINRELSGADAGTRFGGDEWVRRHLSRTRVLAEKYQGTELYRSINESIKRVRYHQYLSSRSREKYQSFKSAVDAARRGHYKALVYHLNTLKRQSRELGVPVSPRLETIVKDMYHKERYAAKGSKKIKELRKAIDYAKNGQAFCMSMCLDNADASETVRKRVRSYLPSISSTVITRIREYISHLFRSSNT
ncbi:hypothetical protein KY330_05680 [Candidatus Woesearchaeota archaeon]|nr:hypothetical protein [Candidatus Woesearchaeota archaeon]